MVAVAVEIQGTLLQHKLQLVIIGLEVLERQDKEIQEAPEVIVPIAAEVLLVVVEVLEVQEAMDNLLEDQLLQEVPMEVQAQLHHILVHL